FEDTGDFKAADGGSHPDRCQFPLRAYDVDYGIEHHARILYQARPQYDAWRIGGGIAQAVERAGFEVSQGISDGKLGIGIDAFQKRASGLQRASEKNFANQRG